MQWYEDFLRNASELSFDEVKHSSGFFGSIKDVSFGGECCAHDYAQVRGLLATGNSSAS